MPADTALESVTLGEVFRTVQAQSEVLKEIRDAIDKRPTMETIERIEKARDLREEAHRLATEQREQLQNAAIKDLEDTNTWLTRTTFGALITALAGLGTALVNTLARLGS